MQATIKWTWEQYTALKGLAVDSDYVLTAMREHTDLLTDEQRAVVESPHAKIKEVGFIGIESSTSFMFNYTIEAITPRIKVEQTIVFAFDTPMLEELASGRRDLWEYFREYQPESGDGYAYWNDTDEHWELGDGYAYWDETDVVVDRVRSFSWKARAGEDPMTHEEFVKFIDEDLGITYDRVEMTSSRSHILVEFTFIWEEEADDVTD